MKIYEENYIHTQDIALNVASYEKKSNNINILFVHGFLERWQSWEQTMSFLPKHYNLFASFPSLDTKRSFSKGFKVGLFEKLS